MAVELKHLRDLWNEADIAGMDEAETLRYRSNLLGSDLRLTNFGGGNTSAKIDETDPITGESVPVLWVKGSGGDLGSIKRDGFATVYMSKLLALKARYGGVHEEDAMADKYAWCTFNNNPRAASIDTPLHGFLPFKHVDHLHPDWAISIAACANGPEQVKRLADETGIRLAWLPWKRPGFELGLWLERAVQDDPTIDGILLGSHGLFTWGDTCRGSYENTLRVLDAIGDYVLRRIEARGSSVFGGAKFVNREDRRTIAADLMPTLRGLVGASVGHFQDSDDTLQFVNSHRAQALAWQGTSCPDHFVRTKVRPLYLDWDPGSGDVGGLVAKVKAGIEQYARDYHAYYESNKLPDSPAIRSATPSVVLVPGVGMFSFARNKTEARITGEFYVNAIHVMQGATCMDDLPADPELAKLALDNYVALTPKEAFGIEYWLLEEAKLKRMPAEKELSRKVALVVGAGQGIGMATAESLLAAGAHVVLADVNAALAEETASLLAAKFGKEVVGWVRMDATDRDSVKSALSEAALQFAGIDIAVYLAAVFFPPDESGRTTDHQWQKTYDVNVLGSLVVAEEAYDLMAKQGTKGSIILTSSANAVVSKKGSLAYDTGKAAVNHLVRELAVTCAPLVRVNGVAPATVVGGSQQFPRERVITSLQKYNVSFDDGMSDDELRDRLAGFYAQRTLLKMAVTPQKVAEAVLLLAGDRLGMTTGQVLAVDAGLTEAFLR
jgi:rhamnulose-1-phosphate aldolase/alcohol dehydrogenase